MLIATEDHDLKAFSEAARKWQENMGKLEQGDKGGESELP
jgi:hypothetical protein